MTNHVTVKHAPPALQVSSDQLFVDGRHVIDRFLAARSSGSRDTIFSSLGIIGQIAAGNGDPYSVPWHRFDSVSVQEIAATLREIYAPNTCRKMMSFLKGILAELYRLRIISDEQFRRITSERIRFGRSAQAGRAIEKTEESSLLSHLRNDVTPLGRRDFAMICLLRYCGLRRAELRDLSMDSLDSERGRLRVSGKGDKERYAILPPGTLPALAAWFEVRGSEPGPMFIGLTHRHPSPRRDSDGALSPMDLSTINAMLHRRQIGASISAITPHDLRRTFGTRRLQQGATLKTVQELMGHASITTTSIYVRISDDDLRASAQADAVLGGEPG